MPLPLTESAKIISHPRLHRLDGVFMCLCASAPVTLAWKRQEISQVGQHVHVLLFGGDGGELLLRDCSHKRGAKPFRINRFRDVLAAPHLFFFGHSRGHAERVMHRPKSRRFISLSSSPPPLYAGSKQACRRCRRTEVGGLRQYHPRSAGIFGAGIFEDDDMLYQATFQSLNLVHHPPPLRNLVCRNREHLLVAGQG